MFVRILYSRIIILCSFIVLHGLFPCICLTCIALQYYDLCTTLIQYSEYAGKVGKVGRIIEAVDQSGLGDAAGRLYERIKKIDEEDRKAGTSRWAHTRKFRVTDPHSVWFAIGDCSEWKSLWMCSILGMHNDFTFWDYPWNPSQNFKTWNEIEAW